MQENKTEFKIDIYAVAARAILEGWATMEQLVPPVNVGFGHDEQKTKARVQALIDQMRASRPSIAPAAGAVVVIDGIDVQVGEGLLDKRVFLAVPGGAQSDRRPLTQADVIASIKAVAGYSDEGWQALPDAEKTERLGFEVEWLRETAERNSNREAEGDNSVRMGVAGSGVVGAEIASQAGTALGQSVAGTAEGSALPQIVLGAEGQGESATAAQIRAAGTQEA